MSTELVDIKAWLAERIRQLEHALAIIEQGDNFAYSNPEQVRRMRSLRDRRDALRAELTALGYEAAA